MSVNLTLTSLYRIKGQEGAVFPGLLAQMPPRKAARGRENDRLLLFLHLGGNVPFTGADYAQLAALVAQSFYNTAGSLTFALKSAIETLNTNLAERNMRSTGQGKYVMAALTLAALRDNALYLAQSGPTRVFWLGLQGLKTFYEPPLAGKGLGLGQTTRIYFSQQALSPGDRLLLCLAFPPEWENALKEERGPASFEMTYRRLLAVTSANLNATLVGVSEGEGLVKLVRLEPAPQVEPPQPAVSRPESSGASAVEPAPQAEALQPAAEAASAPQPAAVEVEPAPQAEPTRPSAPAVEPAASAAKPVSRAQPSQPAASNLKAWLRQAAGALALGLHVARSWSQKLAVGWQTFAPRLLPAGEEDKAQPSFALRFASLALPVMLLSMAVFIYLEKGRPAQYRTYFDRAVASAMQTIQEPNPIQKRLRLKAALDWLDKAETYQQTAESRQLRQETQTKLDNLNLVWRANFSPALKAPLSQALRISKLAATDTDLYLLNAAQGNVLRAFLQGNLYALDENFSCAPGTYDGLTVGPLIDMIALPRTTPNGITLMAIDSAGHLLYCRPGSDQPPSAFALQKPSLGWGEIDGMAYDTGTLYVLDAANNGLWFYYGAAGVDFPEPPQFFFEQQIPYLNDAVGLAVNGDDIFLLHADGHLTTCTFSRLPVSPTRCQEPATLTDTRPGYDSGVRLADGIFSQVQFTPAPDPSVAMLEPLSRSIFRFAPRTLQLQRVIQSSPGEADPLAAGLPISAMTFSPNKGLFVLSGGQVYLATNLP